LSVCLTVFSARGENVQENGREMGSQVSPFACFSQLLQHNFGEFRGVGIMVYDSTLKLLAPLHSVRHFIAADFWANIKFLYCPRNSSKKKMCIKPSKKNTENKIKQEIGSGRGQRAAKNSWKLNSTSIATDTAFGHFYFFFFWPSLLASTGLQIKCTKFRN